MTKLLLALLPLVPLAACVANEAPVEDLDLAADETVTDTSKADAAGWEDAPTLHDGTRVIDHAGARSRRVHSIWIAATNNNRTAVTIRAHAIGEASVRIAVLGPLADGARPVLAADGYASTKRTLEIPLLASQPGEYLVVVGSHDLATDTTYELSASCDGDGCGPSRIDALATPKAGALVGDSQRLVSAMLGDMLVERDFDVQLELWASPPMQPWSAHKVATSTASGTQVNAIVPASVRDGDDLRLVVKDGDGRVLDSGVTTRFSSRSTAFARTDAILYGDLTSLQIAGVVGYYEGIAELVLRSEVRRADLAHTSLHADGPGDVGNGLGAFDATFAPEPGVAAHDGELLSVGFLDGNGDYRRLACFEYCNNLSGLSSCTGGPRNCP